MFVRTPRISSWLQDYARHILLPRNCHSSRRNAHNQGCLLDSVERTQPSLSTRPRSQTLGQFCTSFSAGLIHFTLAAARLFDVPVFQGNRFQLLLHSSRHSLLIDPSTRRWRDLKVPKGTSKGSLSAASTLVSLALRVPMIVATRLLRRNSHK
jgi:hypothetical protein